MAKVRCKFCQFEEDGKCSKKKSSVKLNKKRDCAFYKGDEDKVMNWAEKRQNISLKSVLRPDWWWDRAARRKERDGVAKQDMEKYQTTIADQDIKMAEQAKNPKHPVTGDLSRFLGSTVEGNQGKDKQIDRQKNK